METYHKIQTLFKRHLDGPKKGKMIKGAWTTPALEDRAGNKWEFTEKVDGTNIRIGFSTSSPFDRTDFGGLTQVKFGGRTNNAVIPTPLQRHLEETFFDDLFMDNKLNDIVLFGEGYGPKIQNGGKYFDQKFVMDPEVGLDKKHKFVLFDVKIGDTWLERHNVDDIARKLGIEHVPTIGHGTLHEAIEIVSTGITFESSGGIKRWGRGGLKSAWGDFEAEGIVARTATPLFDRRGERMITKIKAVDFK
jgi:hypothetical protein